MLEGQPAIRLNGEPVVIVQLGDLLEQSDATETFETNACVVLQVNDGHLGLLVDELTGEEEVVLKPLTAPLKRVRNVSALAILGNGAICPVLSPSDLFRTAHKYAVRRCRPSSDNSKAAPKTKKPSVLLAEDSALIRAMEKRILEDANYEVVTAVDGLDALNLLSSRPFAALVTDIVMPNIDGLTLTSRVRAMPRYQSLPIILVTSLASDDDKKRGLDAGANAYIPKPTFDQRSLLDTLKRLIAL